MAYKIPGLGESLDGVPQLWDTQLKGTTTVTGTLVVGGASFTVGTSDGSITTGNVKYFDKEVTCSNGTAVETAIATITAGSIILDVMTICTEAFNGGTTKTFKVGLHANTDKYIDDVDCPVTLAGVMDIFIGTNQDQKTAEPLSADMIIVSTHTNSAGATTGKVKVRIVYI